MNDVILTALISNSLVLGILAFLSKSIVKHFLDKDISTYKLQLQSETAKEIEKFKSQLEVERVRLQISYSGIFEKQAQSIMELYDKLLKLEGAVNDGIQTSATWNQYQYQLVVFRTSYHENRILLPDILDKKIENAMGIAIKIMGASIHGKAPSELLSELRDAKNTMLIEMRKLLAVVVPNNS